MICCIILIVVGCLTTTAISASSQINPTAVAAASSSNSHTSNNNRANFNGNGILRDDDGNQDIGFAAAVKSHKKQINDNDDFNTNNHNRNNVYSTNIANDAIKMNAFNDDDTTDDDDDDESSDFLSIEIDDQLSLKDQMRMLTQQMTKRFQHELKAAVRKTTNDLFKADFQAQLEQLR